MVRVPASGVCAHTGASGKPLATPQATPQHITRDITQDMTQDTRLTGWGNIEAGSRMGMCITLWGHGGSVWPLAPPAAHFATLALAQRWRHTALGEPVFGPTVTPEHHKEIRMRYVKWLFLFLAMLVLVLLVGGMLLSPKFVVQRSVKVAAPADKVYALVADPRQWKGWSVWNQRDPNMQITYSGPPSGAGAVWAWTSKTEGDGKMSFTTVEPGKRVAYDLYFPDFGTTSSGDFTFEPLTNGTRVTWVMNGDMGRNPLFRWMALFADGMVGQDFEAGLNGLKALAEKP